MAEEFTPIIERIGEWYVASCPQVPGANGQGKTEQECLDNHAEAIELILEDKRQAATPLEYASMDAVTDHNLIAAAKAAPLFSALDDAAVEKLLLRCHRIRRAAGTVLFGPTEAAERFFVVLAGRVKLYKLSAKGDEQILHLYGSGNCFGEAAVLVGRRYPAFAEVTEDATLLSVGRKELREAIEANPELAMGMLAGMSIKLREFNRLIEDLSLKEVPARLAGALLRMARDAGSRTFRLQQTKRELAGQIGTAAETLSRALGKLKAAGLVEVRGSQITILDPDGLADAAGSG